MTHQSLLTEHFDLDAAVDAVVSDVPLAAKLSAFAGSLCAPGRVAPEGATNFLKALTLAAQHNSNRSKYGRRYDSKLKMMAAYLYINGGLKTYEVLSSNLAGSIPSVHMVKEVVRALDEPAVEGEMRFQGLRKFLDDMCLPLVVHIQEDATRIKDSVEYDAHSDRCVGFAPPLDGRGLPDITPFAATSSTVIQEMFAKYKPSKFAYTIMAQPLQQNAPSFCLSIYGTDNKFTAKDVYKRWKYMKEKAQEVGIVVLSFASDGDSRLLSAMRTLGFPTHLSNPNAWKTWFRQDIQSDCVYFQDTTHIGAKLRVAFLKRPMPMGDYEVSSTHLNVVLLTRSKLVHGLTRSDLDLADKSNFRSVRRMTSEGVLSCLRTVPDAAGTETYLMLISEVLDSFMDPSLPPEKRIFLIWRWVFFMRIWRLWLEEEGYSSEQCISLNAYICIELNAHSLIKVIRRLRDEGRPELFLPNLLSSQACEGFFRAARSLTSTLSTVVNFTILDFLRRRGRIELMEVIANSLENDFSFPRETRRQDEGRKLRDSMVCSELPSDEAILACVATAREEASLLAESLGMQVDGNPHTPQCLTSARLGLDLSDNSDSDSEAVEDPDSVAVDHGDLAVLVAAAQEESNGTAPSTEPPPLPANRSLTEWVNEAGVRVHIRKGTLCWLLRGGQRVSADRLLRFRTQDSALDDACTGGPSGGPTSVDTIHRSPSISIGQWCLFDQPGERATVGRVLGFRYLTGSTERSRRFTLHSAPVTAPQGVKPRGLGVLCSWFSLLEDGSLRYQAANHKYVNIDSYRATVPAPNVTSKGLFYSEFMTKNLLM